MRKLVPILAIVALFLSVTPVSHAQQSTVTFDSATYTREVAENTAAGQNVGTPVAATGGTGALTYTLGGTDAAPFDISGRQRADTHEGGRHLRPRGQVQLQLDGDGHRY